MDFTEFAKDRNEALLSLNKNKIMRYAQKYGVHFSDNEEIFWASVHKARLLIDAIPESEKQKSRKWLKKHGFRTEDV